MDSERRAGKIVYPPIEEMYTFSRCSLANIKVVILGQDPYHGPNQAHGLCFSVKKGIKPPPSLMNIYNEMMSDLGLDAHWKPNHGYLLPWCEQGVFLLNSVLSVRKGEPASHAKQGWETFTDHIISLINQKCENVVFMLWGAYAIKKGAAIDEVHDLNSFVEKTFCFKSCSSFSFFSKKWIFWL